MADSPECAAFCAKVKSLGCSNSGCDRNFWCALSTGECAEQKRAELECKVDQGSWQCLSGGGWSLSSGSCPSATCPPEAGTGDAGTD